MHLEQLALPERLPPRAVKGVEFANRAGIIRVDLMPSRKTVTATVKKKISKTQKTTRKSRDQLPLLLGVGQVANVRNLAAHRSTGGTVLEGARVHGQ